MEGYLLIVLGIVLLLLLIGVIAMYIVSPGKAELFVGENGNPIENSISVIEKMKIGSIDQYLIIRGLDSTKPVLLFLHGGPGTPELGYMKKHNPDVEKNFVVVHWEQRAASKSYHKNIPKESMTLEQFVSDTKEISEYLIKRFSQKKIYLMGHSWGSYLGIHAIKDHPELYHCYFSIGQVADQMRSERISFDWVKEQSKKYNDKKGQRKLNALSLPTQKNTSKQWLEFLITERHYIDKYKGGLFRDYKGTGDTIFPVLWAREYTLKDKMNYVLGSLFSIKQLWEGIIKSNLFETITSVDIPVYFLHGLYDYQTTHLVAKEFYEQLQAPGKEFFTFEHSAHSPIFDEPDKFNEILRTILASPN